jgi:hypothetical protein
MIKTKGILAVGIILLFAGVALNPATAQTTVKSDVTTIGNLATVQLSDNDRATMEKFLPALMEKMQTATSSAEMIDTIHGFIKEYGRHPLLVLLLTLIIKVIDFQYNFNQIRPVRKTAFIMSTGFTNRYLPIGKNKVSLSRPITAWYYSGRSDLVLNSRTTIVDLYPFSIRSLTGRQIGVMTNFVGVYIHLKGDVTNKAKTFFFGYAGVIRGFDLSPLPN